MLRMIVAVVAFGAIVTTAMAQAPGSKATVFVGPQIREGFVDIDAGIRDSIRDIQQECQAAGIGVVSVASEAQIQLIVLGRGMPVQGSVGSGSAVNGIAYGFVVPNQVPTITTVLKVGSYERTSSREGGNWRNAAKNVVDDLKTWIDANREALLR